jgi:hypothetical protein
MEEDKVAKATKIEVLPVRRYHPVDVVVPTSGHTLYGMGLHEKKSPFGRMQSWSTKKKKTSGSGR